MENHIINKTTPLNHPIQENIKNRWSPRVFAKTPISEQEVKKLLEAGR
jgi:nitroreductase